MDDDTKSHTATLIKPQVCVLHRKLDHLPSLLLRPLAAFAGSAMGLQILAAGPIVCFSARCSYNMEEGLKLARRDGLKALK